MKALSTTQHAVFLEILKMDANDELDHFLIAEAAKQSWENFLQYFPPPPVSRTVRELIVIGNREVYREALLH